MLIRLDYFKRTGKWYSEGMYKTSCKYGFELPNEVREMRASGNLPGLKQGSGKEFIILISPPDNFGFGVKHLLS